MPFASDIRKLDEGRFYSLFCEDSFSKLSPKEKMELLQEAHIREAARMGIKPVHLDALDLQGSCEGAWTGKRIVLDSRLLVSNKFNASTTGAALLNVVLHEGRHAFQTAMLQNPEKIDKRTYLRWLMAEAVYYDTDTKHGDDAWNKSWALYAMQPIETDARRYARRRIEQIGEILTRAKGRPDRVFTAQIARNLEQDRYAVEYMSVYWTEKELRAKEEEAREAFRKRFPDIYLDPAMTYFDDALTVIDMTQKKTEPRSIIDMLDMHADAEQGVLNGFCDVRTPAPERVTHRIFRI